MKKSIILFLTYVNEKKWIWGGLYNLKYEGDLIKTSKKHEGFAIINQDGNGAIIEKTRQDLVTPLINPDINQTKASKRKIKN